MTYETIEVAAHPIKAWVRGVPVEPEARQQLVNIANLPFIHEHVAVMPDVHLGKGATVGSVIATKGAVVPAAVGVDIGCGMIATCTNLTASDLPDSLKPLRDEIERLIPVGMASHPDLVPAPAERVWRDLAARYAHIEGKHPKIALTARGKLTLPPVRQVGTLGGGNHFVEVCLDETNAVWIFLHSGSRGIGNRIGSYFIEHARERFTKNDPQLPDRDLAWLDEGTPEFDDYVEAVGWAQDYAAENRNVMLSRVLTAMANVLDHTGLQGTDVVVNCHHNYVNREQHFGETVWVTRKGAVRARLDELGLIPGSMGTRSYVVRGLGNCDSFQSCSHGAGRRMSRSEAKRRFTLDDHIAATAGVECRKDEGVIDETPAAYKDIDAVMAAQTDLVEIVHTLRQVLCVKG